MENLTNTNFEDPEQVVTDFIKAAYQFSKRCPIGPKGDTETCIKSASELIHYFTYLKFHPYKNYRYSLDRIKKIKEITSVETLNNKETHILTKKYQSAVPECLFKLIRKNGKWKISDAQFNTGINRYSSVF